MPTMILKAPVLLFTGCINNTALQPQIYFFTVANNGAWLRVSYFGQCWGSGDLHSAPEGCGSGFSHKSDAGIAKYGADIQGTALMPILGLAAPALFMISSIAFSFWADLPLNWPKTTQNRLTFGLGMWSVVFSIGAFVQLWQSVNGMENAVNVADNPGFKITKNMYIMSLQGVIVVVQLIFMVIMGFLFNNMPCMKRYQEIDISLVEGGGINQVYGSSGGGHAGTTRSHAGSSRRKGGSSGSSRRRREMDDRHTV